MGLEDKLNIESKGLLSKISNKIKNSLTTKVLAYGLAGSLALGGVYCGGGKGNDAKSIPITLNYDPTTDSVNVKNGEILNDGNVYNEIAAVNPSSLSAIRVNDKVYLWFTEMGSTELNDEKSAEALIRKVFYVQGSQISAPLKESFSQPATGETLYGVGVSLQGLFDNEYLIKNYLSRLVAMETDMGLSISMPAFIEPMQLFDPSIYSLVTNWQETSGKVFLYQPSINFVVGTAYFGSDLHMFGSIARLGYLPIVGPVAITWKNYISQNDINAALNANPDLFSLVNFVDNMDIAVDAVGDLLGVIPVAGCASNLVVAGTLDPIYTTFRSNLINSPSLDTTQEILNNLATASVSSTVECACTSTIVCEIARVTLSIIGTLLPFADVQAGGIESFIAKPYEVIPLDCAQYYWDGDGDGFGKDTVAICGQHDPRWLTIANDCNDLNNDIYPNAPEICDGVDNQCPGNVGYGTIDEGCGGLTGKIAFVSNRGGYYQEIYKMNADGSNQVNLTNNSGLDDYPDWSPDGSKIAFQSYIGGDDDIYVMNADGSNRTNLTKNLSYNWHPSWSPDGSKITFTSARDGNNEIYIMNADGSNQIRLTNNTAFDYEPDWSPDGSKIAFVSDRDGNNEIYIMNADGSNQVRLTNNPEWDWNPDWSP